MCTNNLTIVCKDKKYKVAQYSKYNGFPEHLGCQLLAFVTSVKLDEFRKALDKVEYLSRGKLSIIDQEIDLIRKDIPDWDWTIRYPELSNNCGVDILTIILFKNVTRIQDSLEFAANSLLCEWAYVIDLDTNKFEVYKGGNHGQLSEEDRFYFLEDRSENGYHPVRLVKTYDLSDLPSKEEFVADFIKDE